MTDRIKGFTVVLDRDIRTDDFEAIRTAVLMIKGVQAINPSVCEGDDWMNRSRVGMEFSTVLWDVLHALRDGRKVTIETEK